MRQVNGFGAVRNAGRKFAAKSGFMAGILNKVKRAFLVRTGFLVKANDAMVKS